MNLDPMLEVRDLRKSFGGVEAVAGLDLRVYPADIVGMIGPNGSGKTTVFNLVTGLLRPSAGSIRWGSEGREISGLSPWRVFELGVARTFQNIRLPLGLSVLDNVMIGVHREARTPWIDVVLATGRVTAREARARRRALEALDVVARHLLEVADRPVGELSYADRRRVEIARAVAGHPKLLLLDEPTAGMNPVETEGILGDIARIHEMGVAVLLIEHKMRFVGRLAERVVVLNFGHKIAEGTFEEIREDPRVIEAYLGRRRTF